MRRKRHGGSRALSPSVLFPLVPSSTGREGKKREKREGRGGEKENSKSEQHLDPRFSCPLMGAFGVTWGREKGRKKGGGRERKKKRNVPPAVHLTTSRAAHPPFILGVRQERWRKKGEKEGKGRKKRALRVQGRLSSCQRSRNTVPRMPEFGEGKKKGKKKKKRVNLRHRPRAQ